MSNRFRLQVAELLQRDKSKCMATVQLLSDRNVVLETDYDSVCEYCGDVTTELDY